MVQSLWRIVWRVLKKLKTDLPSDPAIAPLGLCPDKNVIQTAACTPVPSEALFKQPGHGSWEAATGGTLGFPVFKQNYL